MSRTVNWDWDEGIISLRNNGTLLIAAGATAEQCARYANFDGIPFHNPQTWPRAKYLEQHRDLIFEKGWRHHHEQRRTEMRDRRKASSTPNFATRLEPKASYLGYSPYHSEL